MNLKVGQRLKAKKLMLAWKSTWDEHIEKFGQDLVVLSTTRMAGLAGSMLYGTFVRWPACVDDSMCSCSSSGFLIPKAQESTYFEELATSVGYAEEYETDIKSKYVF